MNTDTKLRDRIRRHPPPETPFGFKRPSVGVAKILL